MAKLTLDISTSLDGFAGPNQTLERPLGDGGDHLRLLDELQIHLAPVLLGVRLFDNLGADSLMLETTRVIASPTVTHLKFTVTGGAT
jgi:hypothetical protein